MRDKLGEIFISENLLTAATEAAKAHKPEQRPSQRAEKRRFRKEAKKMQAMSLPAYDHHRMHGVSISSVGWDEVGWYDVHKVKKPVDPNVKWRKKAANQSAKNTLKRFKGR